MAESFTAYFNAVAFAATKNMAALINTHASEVLKIRRLGVLNTQSGTVTGAIAVLEVRTSQDTSGLTGHTTITPTKHDSANTLPASAIYGHAGTLTGTMEILRRVFWSTDEPAISAATIDEFECFVPLNILWDAGYGDANVQPLTLRQNEGFNVYNNSAAAAGTLDKWIEFTKE